MNKKKKKIKYVDDGRTIYNMDVDGMPRRRSSKKVGVVLTKSEKKVMLKTAFAHYLPILFGVLICFGLAATLIYFWLR